MIYLWHWQLKTVFAVVQRLWNYKILMTKVVKSANEHVGKVPSEDRVQNPKASVDSAGHVKSRHWQQVGSWTNNFVVFCLTLATDGISSFGRFCNTWIDIHCCKEATLKTTRFSTSFLRISSFQDHDQSFRRSLLVASPAIPSSADPADADDLARPPSPAELSSANTMTQPPEISGNFVESKIPVTPVPSKDLQKVLKRIGHKPQMGKLEDLEHIYGRCKWHKWPIMRCIR